MINTKLKKVNVMNDTVAKAFLRSKEARMIVASFLSEVTGIDKSVLMNATYTGGEIPKRIPLFRRGKFPRISLFLLQG